MSDEASVGLPRQWVIECWARRVLGDEAFQSHAERGLRVAEEAIELAQAVGVAQADLHRLVDYVYARPVGHAGQEIAGTMVTLYALAASLDVPADALYDAEVARIHTPEIEDKVRRRQAEKRAVRLAIPSSEVPDTDERILRAREAFAEFLGWHRAPPRPVVVSDEKHRWSCKWVLGDSEFEIGTSVDAEPEERWWWVMKNVPKGSMRGDILDGAALMTALLWVGAADWTRPTTHVDGVPVTVAR